MKKETNLKMKKLGCQMLSFVFGTSSVSNHTMSSIMTGGNLSLQ